MKLSYTPAEMSVHAFNTLDVIATSDPAQEPITVEAPTTSTPEWMPTCNAGKPDYNAWI